MKKGKNLFYNLLKEDIFSSHYLIKKEINAQRWVIGDIHGSSKSLKRLLKTINLKKKRSTISIRRLCR